MSGSTRCWARTHCACPNAFKLNPSPKTVPQVWDERLVKTELGAATLRLADVLEQRRFKDRLRMGDDGELDVEARWLAIMAQNRS